MKKILFLLFLSISITSCLNDFLEVEPLTQTSTGNFWKTEADVRGALNAAYAPLRDAYKSGYLRWYEARSDNFLGNSGGGDPHRDICLNRITPYTKGSDWNNWYKMISVANHAIHFIPGIENAMTETAKNHYMSEAYFLRAFAYFNIYRIWGDAPLVTEPILTQDNVSKPARTSKEQIMELVNNDLKKAVRLVDNTVDEQFIYNPGALYSLCTEVAMWNKDYNAAISYSQMLIDLKKYSVEGVDFNEVCALATTADNIWTMKWDYAQDQDNNIVGNLYNFGDILVASREVYDKWYNWGAPQDIRFTATLDPGLYSQDGKQSGCRIWKWSPGEHLAPAGVREAYIPIYRMADILLLRAEALTHKQCYAEALDAVNQIRRRAGLDERTLDEYTANGSVNAVQMEDDILQERQFELFAEGKRWFDLVRTGRAMTVMNQFFKNYIEVYLEDTYYEFTEDWQLLWPISQDILNENDNLVQTGKY